MTVKDTKKVINKMMSYQDVADYFLAYGKDVGEPITNLKLQKLVYYAQAWYLANNSEPLFEDAEFEAWVHGPVISDLYEEYKSFKGSPIHIDKDIDSVSKKIDPDKIEFLNEVIKVYMPYGAYELEKMTHQESPWIDARGECASDQRCANQISRESIQEYYAAQIKV